MSGAIPLLPPHVFMVCTGKTLPFCLRCVLTFERPKLNAVTVQWRYDLSATKKSYLKDEMFSGREFLCPLPLPFCIRRRKKIQNCESRFIWTCFKPNNSTPPRLTKFVLCVFRLSYSVRARLKRDSTCAEIRFGLSAKRTSPFKLAGGVSSVDCWQPRCAHKR